MVIMSLLRLLMVVSWEEIETGERKARQEGRAFTEPEGVAAGEVVD